MVGEVEHLISTSWNTQEYLKNLHPGDVILAYRGFNVAYSVLNNVIDGK